MNKVIKTSVVWCLLIIAAYVDAVSPVPVDESGKVNSNKELSSLSSTRFIVGSGSRSDCITDKMTGLMWPKNGIIGFEATDGGGLQKQPDYANNRANLNQITWAKALTAVINMNKAPVKLCGYSDWRLPNKVELTSLVNYGVVPAMWLNSQGFRNIQANYYWSFSSFLAGINNAKSVNFNECNVINRNSENSDNYVWPVRG